MSSVTVSNNSNLSQPINFSPTMVYKAKRCIKKTLSVGPDHIPSIFWAKLASALSFPVSILFSCSYNHCLLFNERRDATVVPLLKKVTQIVQLITVSIDLYRSHALFVKLWKMPYTIT